MTAAARVTYVTGLMDGLYGGGFFGASDAALVRLKSCTTGMNNKQFAAIVTKQLKDRPDNWHYPLAIEAVEALNASCHGGLGFENRELVHQIQGLYGVAAASGSNSESTRRLASTVYSLGTAVGEGPTKWVSG